MTSEAKRQKLNLDVEEINVSTAECVTFETLAETDYPLDLIAENFLRVLNYEGLTGLGEAVNLVVRAAGCTAEYVVYENDSVKTADSVEIAVMSNDCPSAFPLQTPAFAKRFTTVVKNAAAALYDAENWSILEQLALIFSSLSQAKLQSLRLAVTTVMGSLLAAYESDDTNAGFSVLKTALVARCGDVAVGIRRRALTDLSEFVPSEILRGLNDATGSVRLTSLRAMAHFPTDQPLDDADIARICEMACRDIDLPVRKAALRYIIAQNININDADLENLTALLNDEDDLTRKLAAEIVVSSRARSTPRESKLAPQLVLASVAELGSGMPDVAMRALALGLEKIRGEFHVQWPGEITLALTTDYDKESRKTKIAAAQKKHAKQLAASMASEEIQMGMLNLLVAAHSQNSMGSSSSLEHFGMLIARTQHSDKLLARSLTAFAHLNYELLASRTETDELCKQVWDACRDLFMERGGSSRLVLEAASQVFAAIPETNRKHFMEDVHQDLRIRLASLLGPSGEFPTKRRTQVHAVVSQLIVTARFVDISDLAKLPLWNALLSGDKLVMQLVGAIGVKGDAETVKLVVNKLSKIKTGAAVDNLLRVMVSAKMRNLELDMNETPVDINETQPSSVAAWRAAVAAGVL